MDKTAWLPSDQPHEAASGWVWWLEAATSRYKEKICLFVRFSTCSQNIKMTQFSLIAPRAQEASEAKRA